MSKKVLIAVFACVCALCVALVGCTDEKAAAKAAFSGTWDLVELTQGEEVTSSQDLDTLRNLGLEVFLNLNEDNTAALVMFGEALDGKWEATSKTEGTLTLEDQTITMKIADSKLTLEQQGSKLTFQKGQAKSVPQPSSSSSASASESASTTESSSASESASATESSSASESASASESSSASGA